MSVTLQSPNNQIGETLANGTWTRTVQLGRAYFGDQIRRWDGYHDPQSWSPEECTLMAEAMDMASLQAFNDHVDAEDEANLRGEEWAGWISNAVAYVPSLLRGLAANGGVNLS